VVSVARDERTVGVTPVGEHPGQRALLWFGVLGGALAWGVRFAWSYLLVPVACREEGTWMLHLVALGALVVAAAAGVVSWRSFRRDPPEEADDVRQRRTVLGLVGVFLSGFFVVVTAFESVANFVIDPCLKAAGS
jgi:uncharacterized membrane protein